MKTEAQIRAVIEKLTADLEEIRGRIDNINAWTQAGTAMQNEEFFIAQVKEREELKKQEWQAEYRIRAYKWVLGE